MGSLRKKHFGSGLFLLLFWADKTLGREALITSLADSGTGSLRDAMLSAQDGDLFFFDPSLSGTITLESDLPSIAASYSIQGPTNDAITIDGSSLYQIFMVDSGMPTISHLQLVNPNPASGGAVHLQAGANLNLIDISITQNIAPSGKLIETDSASTLSIQNLTISHFTRNPSEEDLSAAPGSLIIFNTDFNTETDLVFEGTAHVVKQGEGKLQLFSATLETADLTIREGPLIFNGSTMGSILVQKDGFLGGNFSCLSIVNEGILNPGNSIGITQTLGDYNQIGTLEIELSPTGENDLLEVGANAFLDGPLVVIPEPGLYLKGDQFTFLTTGGGINGRFSNISSTNPGLNFSILESTQSIQINILQNSVSLEGALVTGNAKPTLDILQDASINRKSDLFSVLSALNELSSSDLEGALNQLNADAFASIPWAEATTLYQMMNISSLPFAYCDDLCMHPIEENLCLCPPRKENRFWTKTIGERTAQDRFGLLPGFFSYTGGVLTGYDRQLSDPCTLGCYGAYTYSNFHWKDPDEDGGAHIANYSGSLYTAICTKHLQINAAVLGSFLQQNISRHITFDDFDRQAASSPNGHAILGHLSAYGMFPIKRALISPFGKVDYISIWQHRLHEKGASSINLIVSPAQWQFIHAEAGVYGSDRLCFKWGTFVPSVSLSWVLFGPIGGTRLENQLEGISEVFTVQTSHHRFNGISPTVDFGFIIGDQAWLSAAYKGEFSKGRTEQEINMNFTWQF